MTGSSHAYAGCRFGNENPEHHVGRWSMLGVADGADRLWRVEEPDRTHVRLAELVAALSLGIDLGFGQPMEHVLRQCLIALRLGERLGLDDADRAVVYYTALLVGVGCHTDAHEQAKWFGDDFALKALKYEHKMPSISGAIANLKLIGSAETPLSRFRTLVELAIGGWRDLDKMIEYHARMARTLGQQLGLPEQVLDGLESSYEQWDGKGFPGKLSGEQVPLASRISQLAEFTEVAHRVGGVSAAQRLAGDRRGGEFDPALCDLIASDGELILSGLDAADSWAAVIDAEPALAVVLTGERFDAALAAIANFVDLKSPYFLAHCTSVADLAAEAARQQGLPAHEVRALRRAGLVHGFGRLGVSNGILDKRGGLGAGEGERVRLQPYLTERMLRQSKALAPLAAIAVQHRERLDGSGYPRGLPGAAISRAGRLLGAADAYQAMREPRAHRAALTAEQASAQLRAEVRGGRLDGQAVEAVLAAAGHRVPRRREGPAGLTPREVEVLQLAARGFSNKQIAGSLVISPKTVSNHLEHIYSKIEVPNRAGAALFAVQHGLLPEEQLVPAATPVPAL
jgi:HD-GYP domain-containing protein (c-di-GMP phosphodiesterase class II)